MIKTAYEYKEYLRLDAVYNYTSIMVEYIKNGNSTSRLIDLEARRLLQSLEEIDNADFEPGDDDEEHAGHGRKKEENDKPFWRIF